jgi:serine/threonine protein kinase
MGTLAYMPPEQLAGDFSRVGPAADVYSLGATLFELLTGATPFEGGDHSTLSAQVKAAPPPAPSARRPDLDPRFDRAVLTALAKSPEQRWPSMRAFAGALEPLLEPSAGPRPPELSLQVVGTTFSYRPPPGWTVFTAGRQRRKPGLPDSGNDLVIRVAGDEALSARISRRHFEIARTPTGFTLVDRSRFGLTRNGEEVPKDRPVPVADGDLLLVAGVLALKVSVTWPDRGSHPVATARFPTSGDGPGGRIEIEASIGDVMTADE